MSKFLFRDWHEWKVCMAAALSHLWWGFRKIITNTLFGIISLFIFFGKKVEAFCRREALAAFLICLMVILLAIGWLVTYMNYRVQNRTLEYQRDSVTIRLDRVMRTYDTQDTITKDYDIQKANGTMD